MNVYLFAKESWQIEGLNLDKDPNIGPIMELHRTIINAEELSTYNLTVAALNFTEGKGELRDRANMDVIIGNHRPIVGGFIVRQMLDDLVADVNDSLKIPADAYRLHRRFEKLHPFMDGNGRVGRLLWAWVMTRNTEDPAWISRSFLHTWYYQSLSCD